ncbi:major facilitator superfamily domain-containing protein [Sphaerosporella brunnea]|uniref:Major facilitator superfamily domain-containing protein n=1 Tax=Sphaerosporella brunnea TaxID=1250544 RepID=A0A5J5EXS5_9PEZI|nr:major facilitator superfamily domain-containing protein [Sphaerosporella brunnea]
MPSTAPATKDFPVKQLIILALCRICEPISFTSIFPYIYQMIESFGIAKNQNEIGIYAGMVTSAFAIAEFSTGMLWGRISDRIGRKPVLIIGLVGTLISMLIFGFAKSLSVALIARALGGGLNGNIGVIQTTVAELVREKEHQPRAFAIMPFIWCLGSIIGPALGGLLAEPTRFYPGIFPPGGLLEEYPFLLPNMVSSVVLVFGIANGILFLEETHEVLRQKRDYGREIGEKLVNFFSWKKPEPKRGDNGYTALETEPLLSRHNADYSTNNGQETPDIAPQKKIPSIWRAFTRPVIGLVISYGILAYHTMGFEQLMPVFLSTPVSDEKPHDLLRFTGGLGMTTQSIGFILSMQGVFSMCMQFFVFPPVARHFGVLGLYRFCMFTYATSYIIVPYLDWLPEGNIQKIGVYVVLAIKITYGVLAYPCNAILLTNSAPSLLVLGAINGIASSCASLARAISPTVTGMIYSFGLDINCVGLAWWVNAGVCIIGAVQAISMKQEDFDREPEDLDIMSVIDEEAAAGTAIDGRVPIINVDVPGIGTTGETFDEYGLVRSVVEGEITALSESVPPNGTMASLAKVASRIAENNN